MRVMFQFVLEEDESEEAVQDRLARLEEAGVEVDRGFGAVQVSSRERKYVARGEADPETVERVRAAGDVQIFGDRRISPTGEGQEET